MAFGLQIIQVAICLTIQTSTKLSWQSKLGESWLTLILCAPGFSKLGISRMEIFSRPHVQGIPHSRGKAFCMGVSCWRRVWSSGWVMEGRSQSGVTTGFPRESAQRPLIIFMMRQPLIRCLIFCFLKVKARMGISWEWHFLRWMCVIS
jgi:hypothetical protein